MKEKVDQIVEFPNRKVLRKLFLANTLNKNESASEPNLNPKSRKLKQTEESQNPAQTQQLKIKKERIPNFFNEVVY